MRFISRLGRFHEDFTLKEGTVPLPFSRNLPENHSDNLGKALGEGLVLLKTGSLSLSLSLLPFYPFHLSIPFTSLSLLPLYPFYLSFPFTSLSLSHLYPSHLCIPFTSLSNSPSYPSLPLYISPSTFLSLSLLLSLFSLSFSLAYLMDVFVLVYE